jgi:exosortase
MPQTRAHSHVDLVLIALAFGTLWFVLCRHLSGEWAVNEQYSYGWFVPIFAAYLFWLRWRDRPAREVRSQKPEGTKHFLPLTFAFLLFVLLLPLRVFEIGNPDWRPLAWIHTAVVVGICLLYIGAIGGWPWVRHFAFPVCFIFVAVPWVSAVEAPIVEGLMRVVAGAAAETLALFGVPAQVQGNLIRLPSGLVGVNEACSGVRSLQTSLMIGLLFGELKRLSILRRVWLIGGAIAIALVANFLRAMFLVSIAARDGLNATTRWHDIAGYAIVVLVFLGSLALAAKLDRDKVKGEKAQVESPSRSGTIQVPQSTFLLPTLSFLLCGLIWTFLVEIGAHAWYRAHERNVLSQPRWSIAWPENAPAFREIKIDEGARQTLRFDSGREAVWQSSDGKDSSARSTCYLFFFRWNPGASTVLRARAHRPDICLPSIGWQQQQDLGLKTYEATHNDILLPVRHVTFVQPNGRAVAHTFFCLQEDKIHPNEPRPDLTATNGSQPDWGIDARVRVVKEGVRNLGQQVLEIVILTPPSEPNEKVETQFGEIVRQVIVAKN